MNEVGFSTLMRRQLAQPRSDGVLPMLALERELFAEFFHAAIPAFRERRPPVRYGGLGFFFTNGLQRYIQLPRRLARRHRYIANAKRGRIVSSQYPNDIPIVLARGEYRAGFLRPIGWKKQRWIPMRSPFRFPDRPEQRKYHFGRRLQPQYHTGFRVFARLPQRAPRQKERNRILHYRNIRKRNIYCQVL